LALAAAPFCGAIGIAEAGKASISPNEHAAILASNKRFINCSS
jgi:hypothetical protein